jgi:hypothetical protein
MLLFILNLLFALDPSPLNLKSLLKHIRAFRKSTQKAFLNKIEIYHTYDWYGNKNWELIETI